MNLTQQNNPLHGKTLETIVSELVSFFDWKELGVRINIKCFTQDPSIKSSLTFLRKTPWARTKVEELYIKMVIIKETQKRIYFQDKDSAQ
jgi:uncharacterized protein (DUF2132 family)